MSTLEEIEHAVAELSQDDLQAFRHWFAEFDAALWDSKIQRDAADGKLDALAEQALSDLSAGKCVEL